MESINTDATPLPSLQHLKFHPSFNLLRLPSLRRRRSSRHHNPLQSHSYGLQSCRPTDESNAGLPVRPQAGIADRQLVREGDFWGSVRTGGERDVFGWLATGGYGGGSGYA